jgi:hypothetical protein
MTLCSSAADGHEIGSLTSAASAVELALQEALHVSS